MPLVFWEFVTTVLRSLPFQSISQAFSRAPSWRCSCTQKPLSWSVAMAFGHPGGVRNRGVVFARRVGISRLRVMSAAVRPSSSLPGVVVCAIAAPARLSPAAVRNSLLRMFLPLSVVAALSRPAGYFVPAELRLSHRDILSSRRLLPAGGDFPPIGSLSYFDGDVLPDGRVKEGESVTHTGRAPGRKWWQRPLPDARVAGIVEGTDVALLRCRAANAGNSSSLGTSAAARCGHGRFISLQRNRGPAAMA